MSRGAQWLSSDASAEANAILRSLLIERGQVLQALSRGDVRRLASEAAAIYTAEDLQYLHACAAPVFPGDLRVPFTISMHVIHAASLKYLELLVISYSAPFLAFATFSVHIFSSLKRAPVAMRSASEAVASCTAGGVAADDGADLEDFSSEQPGGGDCVAAVIENRAKEVRTPKQAQQCELELPFCGGHFMWRMRPSC